MGVDLIYITSVINMEFYSKCGNSTKNFMTKWAISSEKLKFERRLRSLKEKKRTIVTKLQLGLFLNHESK